MSVPPATPEPRPLSYWLDAEQSGSTSERTVLRTTAYRWVRRRAQVMNLWLATAFFAVIMLVSRSPDSSVPPAFFGIATVCVAVAAIIYTAYHRRRLPSYDGPDREVWIRTTRGGVQGAAVFVVAVLVYLLVTRGVGDGYPGSWSVWGFAAYSILVSVKLIWQGWLYEHAFTLFRDHVEKDARTRTALEELSRNPPRSGRAPRHFGPL